MITAIDIKPLYWKWFSGTFSCVGVVFAYDGKTGLYHGYVGTGQGNAQDADIKNIINHGCRLTQNETLAMIGSPRAEEKIKALPGERWKND